MTGRTYIPEANSLADRVLMFFVANPGEMLTPPDIATKFAVPKARVAESLAEAVSHGALTCEHHIELGLVYARPEPDTALRLPRAGTLRHRLLELLVNGPQSVLSITDALGLSGNKQAHNLIRSGQASRTVVEVPTPTGESKRYGLTAAARLLLLAQDAEPADAPPPVGAEAPPPSPVPPPSPAPFADLRCALFNDHSLQITYRGQSMSIDPASSDQLVRFLSLAWHKGDAPCNS